MEEEEDEEDDGGTDEDVKEEEALTADVNATAEEAVEEREGDFFGSGRGLSHMAQALLPPHNSTLMNVQASHTKRSVDVGKAEEAEERTGQPVRESCEGSREAKSVSPPSSSSCRSISTICARTGESKRTRLEGGHSSKGGSWVKEEAEDDDEAGRDEGEADTMLSRDMASLLGDVDERVGCTCVQLTGSNRDNVRKPHGCDCSGVEMSTSAAASQG